MVSIIFLRALIEKKKCARGNVLVNRDEKVSVLKHTSSWLDNAKNVQGLNYPALESQKTLNLASRHLRFHKDLYAVGHTVSLSLSLFQSLVACDTYRESSDWQTRNSDIQSQGECLSALKNSTWAKTLR